MHSANFEDSWQPCSAGQLEQMVQRQQGRRRRQRRRRLIGISAGVSVATVAIVTLLYQSANWGPHRPGSLACHEVESLLADFAAGKLDPVLAEQVRQHLDRCPHCGELYRQRFPDRNQVTILGFGGADMIETDAVDFRGKLPHRSMDRWTMLTSN